jgi:hypothetical protein
MSKAGEYCRSQICSNAYCVIKLAHIIADEPQASASYENTRLFRCFAGLALYLNERLAGGVLVQAISFHDGLFAWMSEAVG